jgi:hypothetical protein
MAAPAASDDKDSRTAKTIVKELSLGVQETIVKETSVRIADL